MGKTFSKLFDKWFGLQEMRVVMLGLDAAGKTTVLYKLHIGEVLSTVPTIGFNVEKVQYKNVQFTVWDVGGQEKLRPLWRHYFNNTDGLIYVVDSLDKDRIGKACSEFKTIISDPLMRNSAILVFANKQDLPGSLNPSECVRRWTCTVSETASGTCKAQWQLLVKACTRAWTGCPAPLSQFSVRAVTLQLAKCSGTPASLAGLDLIVLK